MAGLDRQREAIEVGTALHRLALRYWARGRSEDARRIASQAEAILRAHSPGSPVLAKVIATMDEFEDRA
ncbi:MAG TPA: hypothetical protein VF972_07280 [Actinomycetota bacterium]